jgi:hypothetical protein
VARLGGAKRPIFFSGYEGKTAAKPHGPGIGVRLALPQDAGGALCQIEKRGVLLELKLLWFAARRLNEEAIKSLMFSMLGAALEELQSSLAAPAYPLEIVEVIDTQGFLSILTLQIGWN